MSVILPPVDTTVRLFDYFYKVRIPYLQSRSIDDIRTYGVVLSGVPEIDNDIQNQWITVMLTINSMVEYYKQDVPIKVCLQSDIKEIYDSISEHITAWQSRLQRGINIGGAPIDDLILMDKFASTIYEHAKYHFTPEVLNSVTANYMSSLHKVNAQNFFNKNVLEMLGSTSNEPGVTRINAPVAEELPERDSLGEFFKNKLINIRRY